MSSEAEDNFRALNIVAGMEEPVDWKGQFQSLYREHVALLKERDDLQVIAGRDPLDVIGQFLVETYGLAATGCEITFGRGGRVEKAWFGHHFIHNPGAWGILVQRALENKSQDDARCDLPTPVNAVAEAKPADVSEDAF